MPASWDPRVQMENTNQFFKSRFQEFSFVAIILLAFIAFYVETDIYTPSFPEMVSYFKCSEDSIQMLLSMNFLGLCLSSLFFGPASDAYGRKTILSIGLGIFMLGSIGCASTDALNWMVLCRFLQGLGCGAIVSAGLACFFDVYPPDKSSRLVSICNGVLGGFMALAPMIGSWISIQMGWRANFYLIAILATVVFLSTVALTKETLPPTKRTRLILAGVLKNYGAILTNFPFMAHTMIWCLMFSIVIVFIANLSLIFVDYLMVPPGVFGFYQTGVMGAFFVGSMSGAYVIKKWGMVFTKVVGSLIYLGSILALVLLCFLGINSPILLILAMSIASLGCSLAVTIYFTFSMTHIDERLKGSAMSLTQSLRLFISSGMVWVAARGFDGSVRPMTLLAIFCTGGCIICYALLYRRKQHVALSTQEIAGQL